MESTTETNVLQLNSSNDVQKIEKNVDHKVINVKNSESNNNQETNTNVSTIEIEEQSNIIQPDDGDAETSTTNTINVIKKVTAISDKIVKENESSEYISPKEELGIIEKDKSQNSISTSSASSATSDNDDIIDENEINKRIKMEEIKGKITENDLEKDVEVEVEKEEEEDEDQNEEKLEQEVNEKVEGKDIIDEEEVAQDGDEKIKDEKQSKDEIDESESAPALAINDEQNNIQHDEQKKKQENLNSTTKEIISDIDINERININLLKQQEQELLRKQEELTREIHQQQLLAQQLAAENQKQQQQLRDKERLYQQKQKVDEQIQHFDQQQQRTPQTEFYTEPQQSITKLSTYEKSQDNNGLICTKKMDSYKIEESSNVSKKIDLQKIFTPATDAEEIQPKNRKLYASSAFYSPTLHPTVEDQVELARRISYSLSDISNQKSKGQSMYVNRKKRSVKWVHEGCGQGETTHRKSFDNKDDHEYKENEDSVLENMSAGPTLNKISLRLIMNPSGHIRDFDSLRDTLNTETGLLSPDKCAEVVTALQENKDKGAELFAKRRKKADNWVVDETNAGIHSPSGITDYQQYQLKPSVSPSVLPAYSEVGKHRIRNMMHQESVLEKYAKPGLKVVKSPWEAALETGSASAAFVEDQKYSPQPTPTLGSDPLPQYDYIETYKSPTAFPEEFMLQQKLGQQHYQTSKPITINHQKDLAYKPSVPQGWNAPSVTLPKELYVPKNIPLESYAPPPTSVPVAKETNYLRRIVNECFPSSPLLGSGFPSYGTTEQFTSPKQQLYPPSSYQTAVKNNQTVPQVNFSPSPLPYNKLAKFDCPVNDQRYNSNYKTCISPKRGLDIIDSKVRNISPTPFGHASAPTNSPKLNTPTPTPVYSQLSHGNDNYGYNDTPSVNSLQPLSMGLLQGQNFNNSARGWQHKDSSVGYRIPPKQVVLTSGNLPYTDF